MVTSSNSDSSEQLNLPNQFDVLVVGTGAAGLYAAMSLPQSYQVGLITKDSLPKSASDWAQGGIAAAISPNDSPFLHIEDTLKAGAGLCDAGAVKFLAEQAAKSIESLVNLGVGFDRHSGELALTLEAAHSRRRVLHAADTTGRAVVSTLTAQVLKRSNIQVIEQAFALNLWLDAVSGRCQGVSLAYFGKVYWIQAKAVVLATGGGGQVFAQTTNPPVNTGDGVAMAWRAGAILKDLEFVQFHPTALTKAGAPRFLISEAVRGEGAHLVDDHGHRFTFDYDPKGELAPRDIVTRAIFSHFQSTGQDPATANVWLDLKPIPPERIRQRFPNIIQVCQEWGINISSEPIPVAPAAHYWMGGISTDLSNQTSIPGLYAVGETACTGVHGANRLASNSLLECIVFGAQLAHLQLPNPAPVSVCTSVTHTLNNGQNDLSKIHSIRQELPRLVWQSAGICRNGETIKTVLKQIQTKQEEFAALSLSKFLDNLSPSQPASFSLYSPELLRTWGETRNLLDIAYLILTSALFRTESRGGHYRTDYPNSDPNWQTHTLIQHHHWWKNPIET